MAALCVTVYLLKKESTMCYSLFAKKESTMCYGIFGPKGRTMCYSIFRQKDGTMCYSIFGPNGRNICESARLFAHPISVQGRAGQDPATHGQTGQYRTIL